MSVIEELIRIENDDTLSFGNYLLDSKKKVLDFELNGDIYKVKTFNEITKLEKNGILLFESVPGSTVHSLDNKNENLTFNIEGKEDVQVTVELETDQDYKLFIEEVFVGKVKSNLSGKINFSVDTKGQSKLIEIKKVQA